MICPTHGTDIKKARLDIYWCPLCGKAWLLKCLGRYKSLEAAAKVGMPKY